VPLSDFAPRGFGLVHHSIAILYHQVPNPNITIRNFFIAVPRTQTTPQPATPSGESVYHLAYNDAKSSANRDGRGFGWGVAHGGRFATPADFPLHGGTPYRGLRVRRRGLGFFPRSRTYRRVRVVCE
jgi:hypothetical protein